MNNAILYTYTLRDREIKDISRIRCTDVSALRGDEFNNDAHLYAYSPRSVPERISKWLAHLVARKLGLARVTLDIRSVQPAIRTQTTRTTTGGAFTRGRVSPLRTYVLFLV